MSHFDGIYVSFVREFTHIYPSQKVKFNEYSYLMIHIPHSVGLKLPFTHSSSSKCEAVFNGLVDAGLELVFRNTFCVDISPDFFSSFLSFFRILIDEAH